MRYTLHGNHLTINSAIKTKDTPKVAEPASQTTTTRTPSCWLMMATLFGAGQLPLGKNPVRRQHCIAQMVAEATRYFVPKLMPC